MSQTITISMADYNSLQERNAFLTYLEEAGVDNWEGYGDASRQFYMDQEDADDGSDEDEGSADVPAAGGTDGGDTGGRTDEAPAGVPSVQQPS